jgi:predicted nuclease with TOPRIM domain
MTQYYSRSKGKFIDIANMPDQYVRNAFVKMCSEESRWKKLAEDNFIASVDDLEKNEIMVNSLTKERDDLIKERDKLNQHVLDMVSKNVYNIMWDNCQRLEKQLKEKDEKISSLKGKFDYWHKAYNNVTSVKGDRYVFSEIPNDSNGRKFVSLLREYLNNVSYKLRVRGQYLNDETKKNEGWKRYSYGQPIEKSKCLRVYLDINKDVD